MMTILENTRTDLENEEFFANSPKKNGKSLKARLNDMKKFKVLAQKDITLFSSPIKTFKSPTPQNSVIFINTSSFHQSPLNATKSMTMSWEFNLESPEGSHFELMMEEEDILKKKDSFLDSEEEEEVDTPLFEKLKGPGTRKYTASMMEKDFGSHMKKAANLKEVQSSVILNKKMVYYDEEGNFIEKISNFYINEID